MYVSFSSFVLSTALLITFAYPLYFSIEPWFGLHLKPHHFTESTTVFLIFFLLGDCLMLVRPPESTPCMFMTCVPLLGPLFTSWIQLEYISEKLFISCGGLWVQSSGKFTRFQKLLRPSSASSHIRAGPDDYHRRTYGQWSRFRE
jgi:hypothetical protein